MPYSPTSGRAHSRNGAEHLRSPTPRPVYSSSSCTIPFMIPCALRACTWCAASPRNVQVRLVCHVSTSVPSVCLRACTCVSVNLDSDNSFHSGVCARALSRVRMCRFMSRACATPHARRVPRQRTLRFTSRIMLAISAQCAQPRRSCQLPPLQMPPPPPPLQLTPRSWH